ncbi:Pentatricopeptide repeat [Macleaya cordata]|uniref:Pentatricopeptide repeat n=1 Tax=Macleaya cordata TaxID=56857 RepID=A0A200Q413_MACCD|nr:Pentatricopeptide repeat [Macleaya cordata]
MLSKISTNLPSHLSLKFLKIYANSGDIESARRVFDKIPQPDLPSWTILISAHTNQGFPKESIELYKDLRKRNIEPDKLVLLSVAKACSVLADLVKAKEIHEDAIRFGFESDLVLGNAFIGMYGKCKFIQGAQNVFDELPKRDVISWTSIMACYFNCGFPREALRIFREMCLNGVKPNSITVSSTLPACSDLKYLNSGREIHGFAIKNGMGDNVFVNSGLVNMYANCLSIKDAQLVFDNMSRRDIVSWNVILTSHFSNGECEKALNLFQQMRNEGVKLSSASWNAMISGCMQNGRTQQALDLLAQMQDSGFNPNHFTVASVLPACTDLESLRGGREIHGYSYRHQFFKDIMVGTSLVFMYAKCGELELSRRVFNNLPRRDTIAWNTMILANSMHGNGEEALSLFHEMLNSGVRPNSVTFTGVLSGCSHSRLVDEAQLILNSMSREYMIEPDADHYSCMVDVLSRAGRLKEAYEFIQKMPREPTPGAWGALLGACRVFKNVELGKIAAKRLFEIEPENPGNYVLLSNILVAAKLWDDASEIRKMMRDRGIIKMPGCSWVQVKNKVYTFVAGDKKNDLSDEIYSFLDELGEKMRLAGYLPDTDFVLQDVDQEEKEHVLCSHSEKLAVAFGVLNLNGESSIRVFKNLRVCGDCHNAIKFMAKIVGVQITLRDSLRFHHFKDGQCSCRDFW